MNTAETAAYIYKQSIKAGMTAEGACGLLGNIQEESGFRPNNLEDRANAALNVTDEQYTAMVNAGTWPDFETDKGVHGGYGLVQTTLASRKRLFLSFMKARGYSVDSLEGQTAFILWEMKSMFPGVWKTVSTSHDLYDCTWEILDVYENPAEKTNNMKRRYVNAQKWFQQFGSKGGSNSMTENEAVQRLLNWARSEIGYHEQGDNVTKYAAYLDSIPDFYNGKKNGFAWCDVFVDAGFVFCFGEELGRQMICQPKQSAGAGCLYSAQYYKQAGRWVTTPQLGDQIFFSYAPGEYSHTGIVESVSNGMVNTIEGNTSDQVARRSYPLASSSIVGYGRPRWDLVSGVEVEEDDISVQSPAQQAPLTVLMNGASGDLVREFQTKLAALGYDIGRWGADGDFGDDTRRAVKKFQADHGLTQDGEIGEVTAAAINREYSEKNVSGKEEVSGIAAAIQPDAPSNIILGQDDLETDEPEEPDTAPAPVKPAEEPADGGLQFKAGDTVEFVGDGHYFSQGAKIGFSCKKGRAKVKAVAPGAKHPYRVTAVWGGGSTVNGWVDADAIRKVV